MVRWPVLVPPPAAGPQFEYHVEHRPQVQKPKPRLPRFPGTATSPGVFNANGFVAHNTFFNSSKNPYTKPRISSDRFWSYQQPNYYSCVLYNQGCIFPHMHLDSEAMAGLPCLEEAFDSCWVLASERCFPRHFDVVDNLVHSIHQEWAGL